MNGWSIAFLVFGAINICGALIRAFDCEFRDYPKAALHMIIGLFAIVVGLM